MVRKRSRDPQLQLLSIEGRAIHRSDNARLTDGECYWQRDAGWRIATGDAVASVALAGASHTPAVPADALACGASCR